MHARAYKGEEFLKRFKNLLKRFILNFFSNFSKKLLLIKKIAVSLHQFFETLTTTNAQSVKYTILLTL